MYDPEEWPPVARLVDGPRDGDYIPMTWEPQTPRPIHRGDIIRVTFKRKREGRGLGESWNGIARYRFEMLANDGSYAYRFMDIEPSL